MEADVMSPSWIKRNPACLLEIFYVRSPIGGGIRIRLLKKHFAELFEYSLIITD